MIISIFKTMSTVDKIKTVGTLIPLFYNNIQYTVHNTYIMNDFDVGSPMAKAPVFQFKPQDSSNKVSISRTLVIIHLRKS